MAYSKEDKDALLAQVLQGQDCTALGGTTAIDPELAAVSLQLDALLVALKEVDAADTAKREQLKQLIIKANATKSALEVAKRGAPTE